MRTEAIGERTERERPDADREPRADRCPGGGVVAIARSSGERTHDADREVERDAKTAHHKPAEGEHRVGGRPQNRPADTGERDCHVHQARGIDALCDTAGDEPPDGHAGDQRSDTGGRRTLRQPNAFTKQHRRPDGHAELHRHTGHQRRPCPPVRRRQTPTGLVVVHQRFAVIGDLHVAHREPQDRSQHQHDQHPGAPTDAGALRDADGKRRDEPDGRRHAMGLADRRRRTRPGVMVGHHRGHRVHDVGTEPRGAERAEQRDRQGRRDGDQHHAETGPCNPHPDGCLSADSLHHPSTHGTGQKRPRSHGGAMQTGHRLTDAGLLTKQLNGRTHAVEDPAIYPDLQVDQPGDPIPDQAMAWLSCG